MFVRWKFQPIYAIVMIQKFLLSDQTNNAEKTDILKLFDMFVGIGRTLILRAFFLNRTPCRHGILRSDDRRPR